MKMTILPTIKVTYLPATNHRCSRLKAMGGGISITENYNSLVVEADQKELLPEELVCLKLVEKLGWDGETYGDIYHASYGNHQDVFVLGNTKKFKNTVEKKD